MNILELKEKMAALEVRSKKALGQNFLVSETVVGRIIDAVNQAKPSFIIEIGPGLGALTEPLTDRKPLLIELDRDLVLYWQERGFEVIEADALRFEWDNLKIPAGTWLVSNLPYQISSSLVIDRCFGPAPLAGMILMFQKEVAQRLTASPRTSAYGMLTVLAQNFWKMSKVSDASPRDFHPPPKIASRVLRFERLPGVTLDIGFLKFTKAAFAQRRKFLVKNLGALGQKDVDWAARMAELGVGPKVRAEELSPAQFAALYRSWKKS